MLVLSRRIGEDICLPELGVRITVLKSKGGRTSIGIQAPEQVKVLRGELPTEDTPPDDLSATLAGALLPQVNYA